MRQTLLLAACASALLAPIVSARAQTMLSMDDEEAIHQSVLLLVERTNNEPMATLQQYAQNSRVTSVNSENIVTGWDGLVRQTKASRAGAFTMQTGRLDIAGMGPDHALVVAPFTMFYRVDGSLVSVPGSMTLAYERTAGGWKIIHEHYSEGLDEQARARIARAASGFGRITPADILRLIILGVGGTQAQLVSAASRLLEAPRCTAR